MTMLVALMAPCYIDMFYPHVGIATLELLERLGVDVVYPKEQTCCGQPMANSGCYEEVRSIEEHCARVFSSFDYLVTPSGSCTHHIRNKFAAAADWPVAYLAHDLVVLLDPKQIFPNIHDACEHPHFELRHYSVLMTGPSGSGDIGAVVVHPAQGVNSLTVLLSPPPNTSKGKG
jgi:Fe-S oxidoreductase